MKYSICKYKYIKKESSDFSINAEFFTPDIVELRNKLKAKNFKPLREYAAYIKRGLQPEYNSDGKIKVLRSVNIREMGFSDDRQEFVDNNFYHANPRGYVAKDDVLINSTGVGTLGRACLVYNDEKYFIDGHITRLSSLSAIKPEFLYVYLNSKYGQLQINKLYKGSSGQIEIYPEQIQLILIKPLKIQLLIAKIVQKSFENRTFVSDLYANARSILLKELNIFNWQLKHKLYSIKKYSDVKNVSRFDAEYFQSKYDEIIEKIKSYSGGWDCIGNLFNQNKNSFICDGEKQYNYVEIGSVNTSNGEISPENIIGANLPANAKIKLFAGDILVSKVRTYRGAVAVVENPDYIGSSAFTVLQEKIESSINKETLYTFLKLKPILDLTLKYNTGTSYPTITDEDVMNMPIPKFSQNVQVKIKENVQKGKKMQLQSKQLLEIAKRGVEIAIEENEDIATEWINGQLLKLGVDFK